MLNVHKINRNSNKLYSNFHRGFISKEAANEERLGAEKKKLEEVAKKKAELEEEQRRIAEENAAKK